jgi:hypothetical protein
MYHGTSTGTPSRSPSLIAQHHLHDAEYLMCLQHEILSGNGQFRDTPESVRRVLLDLTNCLSDQARGVQRTASGSNRSSMSRMMKQPSLKDMSGAMHADVFVPTGSLTRQATRSVMSSPQTQASSSATKQRPGVKRREPPKGSLLWVTRHRAQRVNQVCAVLRALESSADVLRNDVESSWCYPPGNIDASDAPKTDLDLHAQSCAAPRGAPCRRARL